MQRVDRISQHALHQGEGGLFLGVSSQGGLLLGRGCLLWGVPPPGGLLLGGLLCGGDLLQEGLLLGGPPLGDVSSGGCLLWGGLPACTEADPPCEQNDKQVQKYYLAPNFVCGDKNGSMFYEKFGPGFMSECFFAKFILLDIVSYVGCISPAKLNKLTEQLSQKQCSWSLCTSKSYSSFFAVFRRKTVTKAHTLLPIQQVLKK